MAYFKINNKDFSSLVSGMKIGYETLVSDTSGRNAAGKMVFDEKSGILGKKAKVYITLRHTTNAEMREFLNAISGFVVNITFLNPESNMLKTIEAYTGTPEPEYYTVSDKTIFKPMNLNFIEL